jgi:uncharacterized protein (UPF0548 family)
VIGEQRPHRTTTMITLTRPSPEQLAAMVDRQQAQGLNDEPGLLGRVGTTGRWSLDRHAEVVGHGRADFAAACVALRSWAMFRQPWTVPAPPLAPIELGATVGYAARASGVWWGCCCRIVALIDDVDADGTRRFGFEYGTLRGHPVRGEERFLVTHEPSGEVHFSLFAVSRPGRWYTWMGRPLARRVQARFRPGAAAAVRAAVRDAATGPGTNRRSPAV